VFTIIFR